MDNYTSIKEQVIENGFAITGILFSDAELAAITRSIESADPEHPAFRKTKDLFAIRHFLKVIPGVTGLVFNNKLKSLVGAVFGADNFIVKSIYFDKPKASNWFVPYHQDLMISVNQRTELPGYGPWTLKPDQVAVQPPVPVLESIFTLRIHLDDTDEDNGALKVIPGSHRKGIYRPETIDHSQEKEQPCKVDRGAVMIMKPLLLHASGRSTSDRKRRVIHIECSGQALPEPLRWSEFEAISQ